MLALHLSCDFQNPSDFEVPKWNINLTIPLLDAKYAFADIVDGEIIQIDSTDSSTIQIEFGGELTEETIGREYLTVAGASPDAINEEISVPTIADILTLPVELDTSISLPIEAFTQASGTTVNGSAWNAVVMPLEEAINDQFPQKISAIPLNSAFDDAEITFLSPQKIVITGEADDPNNVFTSKITVSDFPDNTGITSAEVRIFTESTGSTAETNLAVHEHDKGSDQSNAWKSEEETTFLKDSSLVDGTLKFSLLLNWDRPADSDDVLIGENTPTITLDFGFKITDPDSLVVQIKPNEPMIDPSVFEPPSFSDNGGGEQECGANAVYSGKIVGTEDQAYGDSNKFTFGPDGKTIESTLPFPVDFKIAFKNFHPPTGKDSVKYEAILKEGATYEKTTIDISEYEFKHRSGKYGETQSDPLAVEEFDVDLQVITPSADYVDAQYPNYPEIGFSIATEQDWRFGFGLEVGTMEFGSLTAIVECPFPAVEDTISGMPTGFTGMTFGGISLEFIMINQIRAPVDMDLKIKGFTPLGDSVVVPVIAQIESPDNPGDSVKTIIRLDKKGTTLINYKPFNEETPDTCRYHPVTEELVCDGWEDVPMPENSQTIIQLLALGPETIKVDAAAAIDGKSTLDIGAAIKGSFELIAPFEISVDSSMTFIPNQSTIIDEWKHDTRQKLRNFVSEALMTSSVKNGFPLGGDISVLMSNRDIFPTGSSDSTLATWRDSLVKDTENGVNDTTLSPTKWTAEHTLEVLTNKCDDLMKNDGSYYVSNVIYDKNGCSDSSAYLIQHVPGETDTVISYIDTLLKIILPSPKDYYPESNVPPYAVKLQGEQTSTSGLDSTKMHLLTDIGKHYIRPSVTFRKTSETVGEVEHSLGQDPSTVSFSLEDTLFIESYIVFQLQTEGLSEKAQDEIVVIYPNGGETLLTGETKKIEWKSLGTQLTDPDSDKFVELFTSTDSLPEVCSGNDEVWKSISGGKINNSYEEPDKLKGEPKDFWDWELTKASLADEISVDSTITVWLRICGSNSEESADCTKDVCDMSRSWFTIKEGETNFLSNQVKPKPNEKRKKRVFMRTKY